MDRDRKGGRHRRSPHRKHRGGRSRSRDSSRRDRDRGSKTHGNNQEDAIQKMREKLLAEAAKRNPDAATVFSSNTLDQDALQRALVTVNSLTSVQQQQQQAQYQNRQIQRPAPHLRPG